MWQLDLIFNHVLAVFAVFKMIHMYKYMYMELICWIKVTCIYVYRIPTWILASVWNKGAWKYFEAILLKSFVKDVIKYILTRYYECAELSCIKSWMSINVYKLTVKKKQIIYKTIVIKGSLNRDWKFKPCKD